MSNESNMPVYPVQELDAQGTPMHQMLYGLTKREYFAGLALAGGQVPCNIYNHAAVAEWCVSTSEAIIAELERQS